MRQTTVIPQIVSAIDSAEAGAASDAPWRAVIATSSVVTCGLVAGLLLAFSVAVMPALKLVPAESGARVMNHINVVILNPVFGLVFGGAALLCVAQAVIAVLDRSRPGAVLTLVGAVVFLIGAIGVTMVLNVPMNDALAAHDPSAAAGQQYWAHYLDRWTLLNHVRTIAAAAATALQVLALTRR